MGEDRHHRPDDHLVEPLFAGLRWEERPSDELDHPAESEAERMGWWSRPFAWALGFWGRGRRRPPEP